MKVYAPGISDLSTISFECKGDSCGETITKATHSAKSEVIVVSRSFPIAINHSIKNVSMVVI